MGMGANWIWWEELGADRGICLTRDFGSPRVGCVFAAWELTLLKVALAVSNWQARSKLEEREGFLKAFEVKWDVLRMVAWI
jgi:hypothetical protein